MSNIYFDDKAWLQEWEFRQEKKRDRVICKNVEKILWMTYCLVYYYGK